MIMMQYPLFFDFPLLGDGDDFSFRLCIIALIVVSWCRLSLIAHESGNEDWVFDAIRPRRGGGVADVRGDGDRAIGADCRYA